MMNREKDFYDYIEERWVLLPHPIKVLFFSFTIFFLFIVFSYLLCWKLRCHIICTDQALAKRRIRKFFKKLKKKLKRKRIVKVDDEGSLDSSENLYNEVKKNGNFLSKEPNLSTNYQVQNSNAFELKNSQLLNSSKIIKKISQADMNASNIKNKIKSKSAKVADYESLISDVYYLDSNISQKNGKTNVNQANVKSNIKSKIQKTSTLSNKSLSFLSPRSSKKKSKIKEETNSKIQQKETLKSKLISKTLKNEAKPIIKSQTPPKDEIKSKVSPSKISGFSALYAVNTKQIISSDKSFKKT